MDPELPATGQHRHGFPAFFLHPIANDEYLHKISRCTACISFGSPKINFKNFHQNPAPPDFSKCHNADSQTQDYKKKYISKQNTQIIPSTTY
jgi:hypothetical protein